MFRGFERKAGGQLLQWAFRRKVWLVTAMFCMWPIIACALHLEKAEIRETETITTERDEEFLEFIQLLIGASAYYVSIVGGGGVSDYYEVVGEGGSAKYYEIFISAKILSIPREL